MSIDLIPKPTFEPTVKDPYGREVRSLRLSVTQRCDLACAHCHREGQSESIVEMTAEEMEKLVRIAVSLGVRKIKLTGGEPLLREDILEIVSRISPLVTEVSLTTNGSRLSRLASPLKLAGLRRVNVSLHTLDPDLYARICGMDLSGLVVDGISAAVRAGLNPVKVNMVVLKDTNEGHIRPMIDFCARSGAVLQLIEFEADRESSNGCQFVERYYSLKSTEEMLALQSLEISINELHRRKRYRIPANGGTVEVEVVRPMHNTEFCSNCSRIRMSSDGRLKPCLLDPGGEVDVLTPMRTGMSNHQLRGLFLKAIENRKPYWS
jgi:cyclic pyranopterin phosphate synthase